ncbi:hypothetical protein V496_02883 [Pseudogymnoascus sp. VKM F-4515 (FW-2607)]|nr:hypothetical protein V496_02883 [Pseudogymnoascus sp. VKM F-4515 (FW-2607)]
MTWHRRPCERGHETQTVTSHILSKGRRQGDGRHHVTLAILVKRVVSVPNASWKICAGNDRGLAEVALWLGLYSQPMELVNPWRFVVLFVRPAKNVLHSPEPSKNAATATAVAQFGVTARLVVPGWKEQVGE